jgi:hypothetical protein
LNELRHFVGVGTKTKIGLNHADTNDRGPSDAANNHFVAPVDGTHLTGSMLLYKGKGSTSARMSGRKEACSCGPSNRMDSCRESFVVRVLQQRLASLKR